ncbi:hypothetical protein NKR19_g1795 [Coniochaeta hoffmannii]|uniref:RRM domain-containing protein n=1 Tax=Coniochaeta hoffmannii TaxID=91930 RepID=A0AA38SBV9_9PEZI|nr:hypothetical protein NKR19_g1795 [Coniochaeta hoffmannii]
MATKLALHPADPLSISQRVGHSSVDALFPWQISQRLDARFSANYQGNIYLEHNRSANIPADKNCALFITGLPPTITVHTLLATIRNIGRVFAVYINTPEPDRGKCTCAAKIIFFERQAAERFQERCQNGLHIPGHPFPARVVWNRIGSAAADTPPYVTRVLMISGPPHIVNGAALAAHFRPRFDIEVDEVLEHGATNHQALVELRFESYRCQAEVARIALMREHGDVVRVYFGPDPCAV